MSFTQPLCNDCWDKETPDHLSPRLDRGHDETCCMCGEPTVSGLYVRRDPTTVPYPTVTA